MKLHPGSLLLISALAALTATAGPLQRTEVPKDPVWLLHADVEALKQTTFGRAAIAELDKGDAQKKLAAFKAIFNLDLLQDVQSITLYGAGPTPQDAVMLVHANFDAGRLTTLAEGAREHEAVTHGAHTIHSWIDERKPNRPRTYAVIVGERVVFGQKQERVTEALDVLDLTKANLTVSPKYDRLTDNPKAVIVGAASKLDLPGGNANAAVLKHSKLLAFRIGEADDKLNVAISMDTESNEIAQQVLSVGQGLVSLAALQTEKPEVSKLSTAFTFKLDGPTLTVDLTLPAEEVLAMIKTRTAKKTGN